MIQLRNERCPVCDSDKHSVIGKPGRTSEPFKNCDVSAVNIVRCRSCSAKYIHPMMYFSDEFRTKLYGSEYWDADGTIDDLKNMGEKITIMEKVCALSSGKTVLDVGCGTGAFVKAAADLGFTVTGMDVDRETTKNIEQRFGCRTVTGLLDYSTFPESSFDVVILSHVIEHLQRPAEMLAVIQRIVKPGGLFVMCTPNNDSLMEDIHDLYGRLRHGRKNSYYLTPFITPYHIVGFNLDSSRRILQRSGFSPEYCKLHSGLEWEDKSRKLIMRSLKVAGALLGKGMSIVTISRKVTGSPAS